MYCTINYYSESPICSEAIGHLKQGSGLWARLWLLLLCISDCCRMQRTRSDNTYTTVSGRQDKHGGCTAQPTVAWVLQCSHGLAHGGDGVLEGASHQRCVSQESAWGRNSRSSCRGSGLPQLAAKQQHSLCELPNNLQPGTGGASHNTPSAACATKTRSHCPRQQLSKCDVRLLFANGCGICLLLRSAQETVETSCTLLHAPAALVEAMTLSSSAISVVS